jgi:uncharacterized membrane protein
VLGVILFIVTEGNIAIVALSIFAFLVFGVLIFALGHGVAEHMSGDNPSRKTVAIGILIVLIGLVVCAKSCRFEANSDPSDIPGWLRP